MAFKGACSGAELPSNMSLPLTVWLSVSMNVTKGHHSPETRHPLPDSRS